MALKNLAQNALAETLRTISKTVWLLDLNLNPIGESKPIVFETPVSGTITMVGQKVFTIPQGRQPRFVVLNNGTSNTVYDSELDVSDPIYIGEIPVATTFGEYTLTGLSATVI